MFKIDNIVYNSANTPNNEWYLSESSG